MPCALTLAATSLFNPAAFMAVLAELGIVASVVSKLVTSEGRTEDVDLVFNDGVGRKAGLKKTAKGSRIVVDSKGLTAPQAKKQHETISKIIQRYVRRGVVEQFKKRGYQVAEEENQADGSIRMLVRRWTS